MESSGNVVSPLKGGLACQSPAISRVDQPKQVIALGLARAFVLEDKVINTLSWNVNFIAMGVKLGLWVVRHLCGVEIKSI